MTAPQRGEIWMVDLDPTRGHEQAGMRPALVVSTDIFNASPAEMVTVLPTTSRVGVGEHDSGALRLRCSAANGQRSGVG